MARRPARIRNGKPRVSELSLHMSVAAFLRRAWPADLLWFHVPNGEKRERKTRTKRDGSTVTYSPTGQKLKQMGALAGVPDFVFVMPNGQAAFLELKASDGVLSDDQITFRDNALLSHCGYATARSIEEAEAVLARWLEAYGLKLRATMITRRAA